MLEIIKKSSDGVEQSSWEIQLKRGLEQATD
jgi:hypothetical protein